MKLQYRLEKQWNLNILTLDINACYKKKRQKQYLHVLEDVEGKLLLELLVGVVDAKLFEAVVLKCFKTEDVLTLKNIRRKNIINQT